MPRCIDEVAFRWNQRVPVERVAKKGPKKTVRKSLPVIDRIANMLRAASSVQARWAPYGSVRTIA